MITVICFLLLLLFFLPAHAEKDPIDRLRKGNLKFLRHSDDGLRKDLAANGQHPYAVVVCCSDSRVVPELIFNAIPGDLFVIRVAGNVLDDHQLGSIQYAVEHLGTELVVMLGHTHCGAIGAALAGHGEGYVESIIDEIIEAVGTVKDPDEAARLNVIYGVKRIREALPGADVRGAVYDIESGEVSWME